MLVSSFCLLNNCYHHTLDSIRHSYLATKVHQFVTSKEGKFVIGLGLGVFAHKVYSPLTHRVIDWLGLPPELSDPFTEISWPIRVISAPYVCILGPTIEEVSFREHLQKKLSSIFSSFYQSHGFSKNAAKQTARVSSLFFTSLSFGLVHAFNAIPFWCHPIRFVPQVVATTIMGFMFGLAKELTGEGMNGLAMPIGMHIGNNTFGWLQRPA